MIYFATVSHIVFLFFIKFILCNVHAEFEVFGGYQVFEFGEGFFAEVAEFQQVGFVEGYELAQGVDFGGLEAVECADGEVEVDEFGFEELAHVVGAFVEVFLHGLGFDLEGDALVGEEEEVLDEDGSGFFEGLFGVDGAVGLDVEGELLVVGALFDAVVVDGVHDFFDGGVDGVDGDDTDGVGGALVLVGGDVATTLVDGEADFELGLGFHVADFEFGVEHLESVEVVVEVAGLEDGLVFDREGEFLVVGILQLLAEAYLLQSQDDVGHVFHHAGERGEFVVDAFDLDGSDSIAFERREKDATQGVADGSAVAGLQRTEFEGTAEVVSFEHDHLVGLLE